MAHSQVELLTYHYTNAPHYVLERVYGNRDNALNFPPRNLPGGELVTCALPNDVTQLLNAAREGSRNAVDQLLPLVYDELRNLADRYRMRERGDHTLQPTAIVHEVYLRLIGQESAGWRDRNQFFAVAAKLMRRVLVDHARARRAIKRGGAQVRTPLDDVVDRLELTAPDLPALDETLDRLAQIDTRKARVVEMRFFGGLSVGEAAAVLEVPLRTVERDWTFAKAWLRTELSRD